MSFSRVTSIQIYANQAHVIDVEADISVGLNNFSIVGLTDKAVEEAKDRVSAAIKNSGFISPKSKNQKTVISLAPAELRKGGVCFDVAIALAYLLSSEEISFDPQGKVFLGELSLDGSLRKMRGVIAFVIAAKRKGIKEIYVPWQNSSEAEVIQGIDIFPVRSLEEIINHLGKKVMITPLIYKAVPQYQTHLEVDFKEVSGQEGAKRALEIAAAGRHSLVMYGPPGTGKTMLAKAFVGLFPQLSYEDMLEVSAIHSSSGLSEGLVLFPPFRAPHHSASYLSIIGGGVYPKPGEITLAHKGVLFLDEFPEFSRDIIESMRLPLEEKEVRISRLKLSVTFPADFLLIAAMNPCPCGFRGSSMKECSCSDAALQRYSRGISGPIADRIDMWVEVSGVAYKKLGNEQERAESTAEIKKRVIKARESDIFSGNLILSKTCRDLLNTSSASMNLSARVYGKIIRISRTIANLEGQKNIQELHILEALQYRSRF